MLQVVGRQDYDNVAVFRFLDVAGSRGVRIACSDDGFGCSDVGFGCCHPGRGVLLLSYPSGSGRVDMLTSPVAAPRAAVSTAALVN